jgi:hypothetical protein
MQEKSKSCGMNQTEGDLREKHHESLKNAAISMYLEGCGFRRIGRLLLKIPDKKSSSIPILEMCELYTYIQKKQIRSEYGLLLIETGCVFLDLKSAMRVQKL